MHVDDQSDLRFGEAIVGEVRAVESTDAGLRVMATVPDPSLLDSWLREALSPERVVHLSIDLTRAEAGDLYAAALARDPELGARIRTALSRSAPWPTSSPAST